MSMRVRDHEVLNGRRSVGWRGKGCGNAGAERATRRSMSGTVHIAREKDPVLAPRWCLVQGPAQPSRYTWRVGFIFCPMSIFSGRGPGVYLQESRSYLVSPSFDSDATPYQSLRRIPSFARCVTGLLEPILALERSSDWCLDIKADRIVDRCH